MGYDPETIPTRVIEKYIKSYSIDRDGAYITVVEAKGTLTGPEELNPAGQQFHNYESTETISVSFPDAVAAGIDPVELMALDDKLSGYAKLLVEYRKAAKEVVETPPPEDTP